MHTLTVKEATTAWYTTTLPDRERLAKVALERLRAWTDEQPSDEDVFAECIKIIRFEDWKSLLS